MSIAHPSTPEGHNHASMVPLVEVRDHLEKYEKASNGIYEVRGVISTAEHDSDEDSVEH